MCVSDRIRVSAAGQARMYVKREREVERAFTRKVTLKNEKATLSSVKIRSTRTRKLYDERHRHGCYSLSRFASRHVPFSPLLVFTIRRHSHYISYS